MNTARWLAPPGTGSFCIVNATLTAHLSYLGFQEWSPRASVFDLGRPLATLLGRHLGPCWVSEWVFDRLRLVDQDFWSWLWEHIFGGRGPLPGPDPCLSCPSFDVIEAAILGGVVRSTMPIARRIAEAAERGDDDGIDFDLDQLVEVELRGVKEGLGELREAMTRSIERMRPILG